MGARTVTRFTQKWLRGRCPGKARRKWLTICYHLTVVFWHYTTQNYTTKLERIHFFISGRIDSSCLSLSLSTRIGHLIGLMCWRTSYSCLRPSCRSGPMQTRVFGMMKIPRTHYAYFTNWEIWPPMMVFHRGESEMTERASMSVDWISRKYFLLKKNFRWGLRGKFHKSLGSDQDKSTFVGSGGTLQRQSAIR